MHKLYLTRMRMVIIACTSISDEEAIPALDLGLVDTEACEALA